MQRIARLWRHRWSEGQVHTAFPPEALQQLERAVAASERLHSGQIRLCIEGGLPYSYIWCNASARERAVSLFGKLRTWDTEHNNGVLIYLLLADHAIEVIADRAAARAIDPVSWDTLVQNMQQSFQKTVYLDGMAHALEQVSQLLIAHFPPDAPNAKTAEQGLPNAPVIQHRFFKDR